MKLGDEVRDLASGFKGVIVSRTEFISGCVRFGVQPKVGKDNSLPEAQGFDENQLQMVREAKVVKAKGPNGGPERKINMRY